jgi:hypothetical protein
MPINAHCLQLQKLQGWVHTLIQSLDAEICMQPVCTNSPLLRSCRRELSTIKLATFDIV